MSKLHPLIEELAGVRDAENCIRSDNSKSGDLSKIFNFNASGRSESVPRVAPTIQNSTVGQSWRVPNFNQDAI